MENFCFCGISGSGLSAVAQILKLQGKSVRGSDRSFDQGKDLANKQALLDLGIELYPQDGSMIDENTACVYYSTMVEDSIPDIKKAKEKNIPLIKRSALLAEIFNQYNQSVAVGGTSGKTTTTAMVGYILDSLHKKPCVINGGLLKNYEHNKGIPNIIYNQGDICVIEADESDGSILNYQPYIGIVNNIELDHKSIEELQEIFQKFALQCRYALVINQDSPNCKKIQNPNKTIYFSTQDPSADFYASNITAVQNGTLYNFFGQTFKLKLFGEFNVSNALAAIATCSLLGIDAIKAAKTLESFLGTKRRLETIGSKNGITIIDDYAHNPHKIASTIKALKAYGGRLILLFQPSGFGPMRLMGKQIGKAAAEVMGNEDIFIMPEIYYSGGTVTKDVSSQDTIDIITSLGKKAYFCENKEQAKQLILKLATDGDRIVIMGARDNSLPDFCKGILECLS